MECIIVHNITYISSNKINSSRLVSWSWDYQENVIFSMIIYNGVNLNLCGTKTFWLSTTTTPTLYIFLPNELLSCKNSWENLLSSYQTLKKKITIALFIPFKPKIWNWYQY